VAVRVSHNSRFKPSYPILAPFTIGLNTGIGDRSVVLAA